MCDIWKSLNAFFCKKMTNGWNCRKISVIARSVSDAAIQLKRHGRGIITLYAADAAWLDCRAALAMTGRVTEPCNNAEQVRE